jgi:hypothetical protein
MVIKKTTVKKPIMKKGGIKKSLPKAKDGISYEQFIKNSDQENKKQNYQSAKISSDFLNNQVDNLRKVQKVYPESRSINKTKNLVNEEKVRANADKVRANAALYKSKKGGAVPKAKEGGDKKWIQKAINPKHKGYCTPMTKPTCTPKRKALAKTLKAMAKKR